MVVWTFIWHALVGLLMLSALTLGAVLILARGIAKWNAHDQANCDCVDCKNRRIRASEKRWQRREWNEADRQQKQGPDLGYISTVQLREGMRVMARGKEVFYTIVQKGKIDGGYVIELKNHLTGRQSNLFIPDSRADSKLWKPLKGMGGNVGTYRGRS